MAINYTISFTFSPSTTISSAQVNTDFSDNANTWTGLEAGTKTISQIKVDADPTTALQLTTKQYVDHYSTYRRPNLQFGSITTVAVESGLDGVSGDIPIQFPDGTMRTETSITRTTFNITRNAVLTTAAAQSGLRTSLSETANVWYALYAVKVTDSSTQWCTVGDTVLPLQANYATLNSNFGTSGWVYLGMIRNGDNSGATSDILVFYQNGNLSIFDNNAAGNLANSTGIRLATTASASSLTYTYAAGTGTTQIPAHISTVIWTGVSGGGSGNALFSNSANSWQYAQGAGAQKFGARLVAGAASGAFLSNGSAVAMDIYIAGYVDGVLGVGSNPLL